MCSGLILGKWDEGMSTEEVIARQASLLFFSLTVLFFSISITISVVHDLREPKSSFQYGFSRSGFFLFNDGVGSFPQLSPVTIANSRRENKIGHPAKTTHISYFLFVLSRLTKMKWPNAPENGGFSYKAITFPNGELRRNMISSASRASISASVRFILWYELTCWPDGSCPNAKILFGRIGSSIFDWF